MRLLRGKASQTARVGAALAAMALVVAGCGDDEADPDTAAPDDDEDTEEVEEEPPADTPEFLTMGTGSTGGTYFPLGGAMAGVWTGNIDGLNVSTQASGASVENLQLLHAGEIDLAMSINGTAANAHAGVGPFEGEAYEELTFLGNVYKEVNQIVARADRGITTIEDLDGATVAIGPPGSGTEVFARAIFERAGIEPGEIRQETFGEAADLLRDGSVDASFAVLALPAGSLEEVARAVDLVLVSLEGELLEQTLAEDPTLTEIQYDPAADNAYEGIDQPATLVTNWASLYARADLHEETAYELVRVLYEEETNLQIQAAHAVASEIQIDTAVEGVGDIPIHPGAQRYYDEVGAP